MDFAFDIDEASVKHAMALLPASAVSQKSVVKYSKLVFGRAPMWNEARALAPVMHALLVASDGRQITQCSLTKGLTKWNDENCCGYACAACERGAYAMRALISQLRSIS